MLLQMIRNLLIQPTLKGELCCRQTISSHIPGRQFFKSLSGGLRGQATQHRNRTSQPDALHLAQCNFVLCPIVEFSRSRRLMSGHLLGVTYYNFTSNQFSGFHGIVIPGTLHDSPYVLDGLMENQSSLEPKR